MELIIGGAYQGKLSYVVNERSLGEEDLLDLANGFPTCTFPCLYHLEALSFTACKLGMNAEAMLEKLEPYIGNAVLVSREIGCGIVPMDKQERLWREQHGKLLSMLAARAEHVTRIFCGIAEVLK